jgi:hypothetical protein
MGRLIWWALCIAVVAAIGVAVFRPAAFFGVSSGALANSVGGKIDHSEAKCVGEGADRWRCTLSGESGAEGAVFAVTTHSYGCWSGTLAALPNTSQTLERSVSGCIGLADEFGS